MSLAVVLLDRLRARGIELVPAGDRLRFRPGEAVTSEEREALRRHKAEVLALLTSPQPFEPLALDPITLHEVLGPRPDPATLAELEAEVRAAVRQLETESLTGAIKAEALLVRGRPVADYLPLDEVARLLRRVPWREATMMPRAHAEACAVCRRADSPASGAVICPDALRAFRLLRARRKEQKKGTRKSPEPSASSDSVSGWLTGVEPDA